GAAVVRRQKERRPVDALGVEDHRPGARQWPRTEEVPRAAEQTPGLVANLFGEQQPLALERARVEGARHPARVGVGLRHSREAEELALATLVPAVFELPLRHKAMPISRCPRPVVDGDVLYDPTALGHRYR